MHASAGVRTAQPIARTGAAARASATKEETVAHHTYRHGAWGVPLG